MAILTAKKWTDVPHVTRDFLLVTKLTDFDSAAGKKSILGIILNISQETSTSSPPPTYNFTFSFRDGPSSFWQVLHTFNAVYQTTASGTRETIWNLVNPIQNVKNCQLRIKGNKIRGTLGINDFGLIYRVYRETESSSLDED